MHGITISRIFRHSALKIGDAQILFADRRAAEAYGYADPADLIGRFQSELQPPEARAYGRTAWALRQLGHFIPKHTVTTVYWPDGQVRGQDRVLGDVEGDRPGGETTYLTYVQEVPSRDLPIVTLANYGVESSDIEHITGTYTVADVLSGNHPVAQTETFSYIVSECETLSRTVFQGRYPTAIALALSDDVAVCWNEKTRATQALPLVRPRFRCDRCGWQWFGRTRARRQCPSCKYNYLHTS